MNSGVVECYIKYTGWYDASPFSYHSVVGDLVRTSVAYTAAKKEIENFHSSTSDNCLDRSFRLSQVYFQIRFNFIFNNIQNCETSKFFSKHFSEIM